MLERKNLLVEYGSGVKWNFEKVKQSENEIKQWILQNEKWVTIFSAKEMENIGCQKLLIFTLYFLYKHAN